MSTSRARVRRIAAAGTAAGGALLLLILVMTGAIAPVTASAKSSPCPKGQSPHTTYTGGHSVSVCASDTANDATPSAHPVAGPMSDWQGVVDYGTAHPSYTICFQQVTGHPWSDAIAANRAQKAGWKTTVLIESNITDEQANSVLAAHQLKKDSVVRPVNGFINTQTTGCNEFQDNRAQAREALTFPGKDKNTPGETAVLEVCGNPVGKPGVRVHKVVLPPGTTTATPKRPTLHSGSTPTHRTPQEVKRCYKSSCGPNGVNAPTVASGNPGPTLFYTSGTAEKVTSAQQAPVTNPYVPNPTYGSNPPVGSVSPAGADTGVPTGTSAGVSAPSGTPNPTGATAQPSIAPTGTTTGSTGNPCEDPNALSCIGH